MSWCPHIPSASVWMARDSTVASTNVCVCLRHVDLVWTVLRSPHMVSRTNFQSQLCHWLYSSEKRWGGQKGIVSTIAMLPTHSHMYAVGSYSSQGKTHTQCSCSL